MMVDALKYTELKYKKTHQKTDNNKKYIDSVIMQVVVVRSSIQNH